MFAAAVFLSAGFLEFPASSQVGAMSAVAVDSRDNIYVLHRGPKPLMAFDKNRKFIREWGEGLFKVPHGLRIDKAGNIWTTDNGNHKIRKFSPDGKLLATIGEGLKSPDDIVFASDGSIFVADAGNGRVVKIDSEGKVLAAWGKKGKAQGEFNLAHSMTIDAQDRIYIGDRGNNRVQVFTSAGTFVAEYTNAGNPFGVLAHGPRLLVADGEAHKITELSLSGEKRGEFGTPETLKLPHIMAINRKGVLFVAEVNGQRVQYFQPGKGK